jgi:diguanylate cyclase (GGDEF)-like protein
MDLLLLWRWSITVQAISLVMIAGFFLALRRANRHEALRWWTHAWLANLVALGVTLLYWYSQPGPAVSANIRAVYLIAKGAFVLWLLHGAAHLVRGRTPLLTRPVLLVALPLAFGVGGTLLVSRLDAVGVLLHASMAPLMFWGTFLLVRGGASEHGWLAGALALRGLLASVEAAAYAASLAGWAGSAGLADQLGTFLAISSAIDTGAEWLLVLGSLLALSGHAQRELAAANSELRAVHTHLRRLADRDPLTGLLNRRALADLDARVAAHGATLVFLDLDEFKSINDRHGHQVGDRSLSRVADALRAAFDDDHALVRYGGDEFLVVAQGLSAADAGARLARVRTVLRRPSHGLPPVPFSAGLRAVAPGESLTTALAAADSSMYGEKRARADTAPPPGWRGDDETMDVDVETPAAGARM